MHDFETLINISESLNVLRSAECYVIFGEFGVPLFNGGTGEGEKEPLFLVYILAFF